MFRFVVGTTEIRLAKQVNKLFFNNLQLVLVNQQCFCKFNTFKIKRNRTRILESCNYKILGENF